MIQIVFVLHAQPAKILIHIGQMEFMRLKIVASATRHALVYLAAQFLLEFLCPLCVSFCIR